MGSFSLSLFLFYGVLRSVVMSEYNTYSASLLVTCADEAIVLFIVGKSKKASKKG
jgi:hypothetical protein